MRAIWKGTVAFGLVSIAVRLYPTVVDQQPRYRQVHQADGGRINHRRVCRACGEEVAAGDVARSYETDDGAQVVLTGDDLGSLPLPTSHTIEVAAFVPAHEVDPVLYHRAYFVHPDAAAGKPYVLLREALRGTDRVAVAKVAIRQREHPAVLGVRGDVLVLHTMHWPDEIRAGDVFGPEQDATAVAPSELAMARSMVDAMAGEFRPDAFTDESRSALQQLLDAQQR